VKVTDANKPERIRSDMEEDVKAVPSSFKDPVIQRKVTPQPVPVTSDARTVFIYYSVKEDARFQQWVVYFADELRANGLASQIDQYENDLPNAMGEWITRKIEECDWTIIVWSKTLYEHIKKMNLHSTDDSSYDEKTLHGMVWYGMV